MSRNPSKAVNSSLKRRRGRLRWLIAALAIVIIIAVAFWLYNRPVTKQHATIPSTTSVGAPVNNSSGGQSGSRGSNQSASSGSTAPAPPPPEHLSLVTPWGNFISNHHPGQNGAPTSESSACNTTPGAVCYIKFTNGSQTRVLDSKVANADGAVIWNWDVKSAGFSAGSWQVSAIASLEGQTKTAVDATPLVIQ